MSAKATAAKIPSEAPAVPLPLELIRDKRIPLDRIRLWGNYRKTFNQAKLEELAGTIKVHGVLENILVRERTDLAEHYDLIFGARRFKASLIAGVDDIPANVAVLSDERGLEVQVVENSQREDVHPIEEAEAFERLHVFFGQPISKIATTTGMSTGHVYARIKLCALDQEGRQAFYDGKVEASTALLLARMPVEKTRKKALAKLLKHFDHTGEPMPYRSAARLIQDEYQLKLAGAPFNRDDAELVPHAGACGPCPKRTGAEVETYDLKKGADVCTDPGCFADKKDAAWQAKTRAAAARGATVLSATDSKKLYDYGETLHNRDYVELNTVADEDPKGRTWKQLLGHDIPKETIARTPSGVAKTVVPRAAALATLKDAGHKWATPTPVASKRDAVKVELEAKAYVAGAFAAAEAVVAAAIKKEPNDAFWHWLAQLVVAQTDWQGREALALRRGLSSGEDRGDAQKLLSELAAKLKGADLRGLIVELLFCDDLPFNEYNAKTPNLDAACALYGVDHKTLFAKARAEAVASAKSGLRTSSPTPADGAPHKPAAKKAASKPAKKKTAKKKAGKK